MLRLEIKGITKSFKDCAVLDGVSLGAEAGEIVVIFGPSGTGKTVLLRRIAGVHDPDRGAIFVDGQDMTDVAPDHRGIGNLCLRADVAPRSDRRETSCD